MLYSIGAVSQATRTVAVVHECQVLHEKLLGKEWDNGCDYVVTNERVVLVKNASKPSCGIFWDKLQEGMLGDIESLRAEKRGNKRWRN